MVLHVSSERSDFSLRKALTPTHPPLGEGGQLRLTTKCGRVFSIFHLLLVKIQVVLQMKPFDSAFDWYNFYCHSNNSPRVIALQSSEI